MPAAADPDVQARRLAFGRAVRARREALGLTQEQLANQAGFDRKTVNRIENAAYSPSLDRIFLLAAALGVHPADLLASV